MSLHNLFKKPVTKQLSIPSESKIISSIKKLITNITSLLTAAKQDDSLTCVADISSINPEKAEHVKTVNIYLAPFLLLNDLKTAAAESISPTSNIYEVLRYLFEIKTDNFGNFQFVHLGADFDNLASIIAMSVAQELEEEQTDEKSEMSEKEATEYNKKVQEKLITTAWVTILQSSLLYSILSSLNLLSKPSNSAKTPEETVKQLLENVKNTNSEKYLTEHFFRNFKS